MDSEIEPRRPATFVVRLAGDAEGSISGLIHDVRTGEKRRFEDLEGLGLAIQEMAVRDPDRRDAPDAPGAP